jgi:hypothetical protein
MNNSGWQQQPQQQQGYQQQQQQQPGFQQPPAQQGWAADVGGYIDSDVGGYIDGNGRVNPSKSGVYCNCRRGRHSDRLESIKTINYTYVQQVHCKSKSTQCCDRLVTVNLLWGLHVWPLT